MQANGKKKVLITGAAGCIGQVLVNRLGNRYEFSSLDLVEAKTVPSTVADIRNLDVIVTAFYGQDAVVHLAADPHPNALWESVLFNNIIGTYNVFAASRLAGIRRVVAASSNHVMWGYYMDSPWKHVIDGKSAATIGITMASASSIYVSDGCLPMMIRRYRRTHNRFG